ncbi:MAG: hypothetical protein NTW86_00590 [Candidatus Sumerlaeota bacterium]|nr:hypothetical protein [Candidatus Sumerlaeota bacterium]
MVEMQRMGYTYCGEDLGVFGVHRSGPPILARLDNLFLWPESLAVFDSKGLREAGADPDSVFFQGLAFRMMWQLYWLPGVDEISFHHSAVRNEEDRPTRWHCDLLRVFARVNDAMRQRKVLTGGAGVLYQSDAEGWTLWAFHDLTLDFPCAVAVEDVTENATVNGPAIPALRHHVYRGIGPFPAMIHLAGRAS